jgi:threonine aldolase
MAEVGEWRKRQGGTVFGLWPYAASCLAALRLRLPRMAEYHRHGLAIADALRGAPGIELVPDPPHTSHLHLLLGRDADGLRAASLHVARERRIWTFARSSPTGIPDVQRVELAIGDATLGFTPEEIGELLQDLLTIGG